MMIKNEITLQFIEQIEHYSLKVEYFLSKDYNIDGEILTKLNNSFKSLYLINQLKIKICYPKYTSVSSPILKIMTITFIQKKVLDKLH